MRYLFLFLLVIPLSSLHAQKTFHAGLLVGINGCQIHGDTYSGYNKMGIVAGAFVCTDPTKSWYLQMELQYSGKGSRKIAHPDKGDYDIFELRMQYVEAPFLFRANYRKLFFEIGETIGVLGNVREWDDYGEVDPRDFRRWESAFIVGGGISFNENWSVNLRYTNSLFPVKKFPNSIYYSRFIPNLFNKGMYNNILGLTACYRFGTKKTD